MRYGGSEEIGHYYRRSFCYVRYGVQEKLNDNYRWRSSYVRYGGRERLNIIIGVASVMCVMEFKRN
jgi:hypothetical protein